MREIRKSGSEGGARQTNVSFLPLSVEGNPGSHRQLLQEMIRKKTCLMP